MSTWISRLLQKPPHTQPAHISTGQAAERHAEDYLRQQGLQLIERNYRCQLGEIDLIMRHDQQLVFVEVRYRKQSRYGSPLESITASKQAKLRRAAEHYLQQHQQTNLSHCRFDVVSLQPEPQPVEWIANAF